MGLSFVDVYFLQRLRPAGAKKLPYKSKKSSKIE
jgi:hypothetical protein